MKTPLLILGSGSALLAVANSQAADKSQYNLFNPTPRELMREMSTDRPDKTESAYTVDAGHFQVEMDWVSYSRDRESGVRTESWSTATANLKVGLCNSSDLQLVVPTYNWVHTKNLAAGTVEKNSGFGDLTARLKMNLWGNDGGKTALAVMPFVKAPTNQDDLGNDAWEGGVIVPLAVELPGGWGLGLMTELDLNKDEDGSGHHLEFINSITASHAIIGDLSGYVEFFSAVSAESDSDWVGTVDLGLTYGLTDDIQLDGGVNIGVTKAAEDINPFVGISWRF